MTLSAAYLEAFPQAAVRPAEIRAAIIRRTLQALQKIKQNLDPATWFERYADVYELIVAMAQAELVILAGASVDEQLLEQGYSGPASLTVNPTGFVGSTGDGRPVMGLAYAAATAVEEQLAASEAVPLAIAWQAAWPRLLLSTQTALSDTSRVAKQVQMTARPGTGWIRMVRPPCCARCAILAGKRAASPKVGFKRHPGCDCDAVPINNYRSRFTDPKVKDAVFDVREYFFSLSDTEQDRIFTKAGAQAIRDGADPAQVVNARRGMTTAVDRFGQTVKVTTEGTTKRGWASDYLRQSYGAQLRKQPGSRYMRSDRLRLMPEEIYKIAGDDADMALNLLHKNGYLTDASTDLSGRWSWAIRDKDVLDAQERTFNRLVRR